MPQHIPTDSHSSRLTASHFQEIQSYIALISEAHPISFNTFNLCWCYCTIHTALVHNNVDELLKWILYTRVCVCGYVDAFKANCLKWSACVEELNINWCQTKLPILEWNLQCCEHLTYIWLDKQSTSGIKQNTNIEYLQFSGTFMKFTLREIFCSIWNQWHLAHEMEWKS